MKIKISLIIVSLALFLTGCAIMHPFKPEQVLTSPLGTDSLKIGMTKEQVKELFGEPDAINPIGRSQDMLSTAREEWVYRGQYTDSPIKADYFGKTLILTFDGNNLTSYKSSK